MEWVKQHPYLAGLGALAAVILYFVLRSSGTASTAGGISASDAALQSQQLQASLAESQIQAASNAQTTQYNAALEGIALQNQGQLQIAQTVAAGQTAQTSAALTAQQGQTAAGLQATLAQYSTTQESTDAATNAQLESILAQTNAASTTAQGQTAAGITIAQIQASQAESLAGTQQQVADTQLADELAQTKLTDAATLQSNSNQIKGQVQLAQINATTSITNTAATVGAQNALTAAQLAAQQNNNTTAITINGQNTTTNLALAKVASDNSIQLAGISAGVQQAQITSAQNLYDTLFADQTNLALQQEADAVSENVNNTNVQNNIIAAINAGTFNKGSQGGANQVAALTALTGNTAPGVAAEQGAAAASSTFWQSLFNAIGSLGKSTATVATAP